MKKEDFKELIEALNLIEKERDISKEVLLKAIEDSLLAACKDEYGKSENIRVHIDPETGEYNVFRDMKVVDEVVDPETEMTLLQAQTALPLRDIAVGDTVSLDVKTKNFGRIAAGKAKQVIVQKLREEERKVLFGQYCGKEKEVVTGIVQKFSKKNVIISLGKVDASLIETEQIPGEVFRTGDRVKVYVVEVKDMTKGPRIVVSRTHPELVKRFFENEVSEVADGTVEIKALSREAGK
ncbi:MAG: S1 RNA-binding domain-containing protein, partial [Lachnospiraceae bacterium]|nr:S1 RNA-binding domain-containing protein [Lachnospiraceae bacterium]